MTMLRVEVSEAGHEPLPPVDIAEARFVIGSGPSARIRLPAAVAKPEHLVIDAATIALPADLAIGSYRIRITAAPADAQPSPPQRTESIARELMRALLGADDAAPSLEVEAGPVIGALRRLAPPESRLVIGRGDEADWIVLDSDLSRTHAEVRRSWDGTRVVDLGSKNGTRVDGVLVSTDGSLLRSGSTIELGKVRLRYRDPADVPADVPVDLPRESPPSPIAPSPPSTLPFYGAVAVMIVALAGLVWVLS